MALSALANWGLEVTHTRHQECLHYKPDPIPKLLKVRKVREFISPCT